MQASKPAEVKMGSAPCHAWWVTALLVIAHALVFRLAFPPANLWLLMPVAIALLTLAAVGARRTSVVALFTAIGLWVMWMLTLNWVQPVTAAGYPFMCVGMMLFGLLYVLIVRAAGRSKWFAGWPLATIVAVVWTGVECFRGEIAFDGYPWYFAAHPFVEVELLIQSADLLGAYFISSLAAATGGALLDVAPVQVLCRPGQSSPRVKFAAVLIAVIVGLNIGYGALQLQETDAITPGPRIVAIQTNLPQENKVGWTREQQARDLPAFIDLTRQAVRDAHDQLGGVDLVIWPETMLPGIGFDPEMTEAVASFGDKYDHMLRWQREILALREQLGTPMLVGSLAWVAPQLSRQGEQVSLKPGKSFNSAYLVSSGEIAASQRYDKFFLTPFGETMPYISAWPWLEEKLLAIGAQGMSFDLDAGRTLAPLQFKFNTDGATREIGIGTPICFEDSVGWVCRRMIYEGGRKRGDLLVNISNDGWFTSSDASRAHHLQISRFRCVENRVPMVRSVNTGLSASIDSAGRVIDVVGEGSYGTPQRDGWLVTQVQLDSRHTLYGRIGDVWAYLCLIGTAGMLVTTLLRRKGAQS